MSIGSPNERSGYTLIELIGAMAAASLLMLTLASSVLVATSMVEPREDDRLAERDRLILDRLSNDLRYATTIDVKNTAAGFTAERIGLQNTNQVIIYQSVTGGLMRSADGTSTRLDNVAPTMSHWVDGYTAPTVLTSTSYVRPRGHDSSSTAPGGGTGLMLEIPANAQNGDLLLLIATFQESDSVLPLSPGWVDVASVQHDSVRLSVFSQIMNSATARTHFLEFDESDDATAALVVIEDAGSTPITWVGTQKGTAIAGVQSNSAVPTENSGVIKPTSLNLQIFAADHSPWLINTLAMPSFADLLLSTGSEGSEDECMLAVTYRSGAAPPINHPMSAFHFEAGDWVGVGLQIDGD
ncbi:MAG: hypothetical protein AAFU85_06905 [Planctomycetota bacterium]